MKSRTKILAIVPIIVLVLLSGFMAGQYATSQGFSFFGSVKPHVGGYGQIDIYFWSQAKYHVDRNGFNITDYVPQAHYYDIPNVVTVIGLRHVRNLLCALNATYTTANNITKYMCLSNDASPSSAWTKLPAEVDNTNGFGRVAGSVAVFNGTAYTVYHQWTASGAGATLRAVGLGWSGGLQTDNNLFCALAFTQTTFSATDTLAYIYTVNVEAP